MAFPSIGSLALDKNVLKGIALDLANRDSDYIADKLPKLNDEASGLSAVGDCYQGMLLKSRIDSHFANADKLTSIKIGQQIPSSVGPSQTTVGWNSKKFVFSDILPREVVQISNARDLNSVRFCLGPLVEHVRQAREKQILDVLGNTSTFSSKTCASGSEWNAANGTPVEDILKAIETVSKFGDPDVIVLSGDAAFALMGSAKFNANRAVNADHAVLRQDEMADLIRTRFGIPNVLIARAKYNASNKAGENNANITSIMSGKCFVGKLGFKNISMQVGNNFYVESMACARITPEDLWSETWYDPEYQSNRISATINEAFTVTEPRLGYVIANCAA